MKSLTNLTDADLISLLKDGGERAYAEIYGRYWPILLRHALRMLKDDEEDARDVLQDTFTMLWAKRGELVITGSLSAFLYAALRNRILNFLAYRKVRTDYLASLGAFEEASASTADELQRERELARIIEEEIALLPPKMRQVFELSRNADLSYSEISEQLDISDHTVRRQISKALKVLRHKLKDVSALFSVLFF